MLLAPIFVITINSTDIPMLLLLPWKKHAVNSHHLYKQYELFTCGYIYFSICAVSICTVQSTNSAKLQVWAVRILFFYINSFMLKCC